MSGKSAHPVPLKEVGYEVEIASGLAIVTQKRVFRNDEPQPIEATVTFPVGYEAIVAEVRATVAGRSLVGVAKAKAAARAKYEQALDDGKAAVLHEELVRGLHVVSVGNVAPGSEIVVETRSVSTLSLVDGVARLRIPLTVGAIYGTSPFIEADDVLSGGPAITATLKVLGADGVKVNGKDASQVSAVSTSSFIDLSMPVSAFAPLQAKTASGSWAKVSFAAPAARHLPLDGDIMLDTSGSMAEACHGRQTKWMATVAGLGGALAGIGEDDAFAFWTFSSECVPRGSAKGSERVRRLLSSLPFDSRGTELAEAVHAVAQSRSEANVLLVTDGKSHTKIDFDLVRKTGARFTVVLIGGDSLEARVGQLAALTGGQLFVVDTAGDVEGTVKAALLSMRAAGSPVVETKDAEAAISRIVGGMAVSVEHGPTAFEDADENAAAAAVAAWFAVAALPSESAAKVAEAAGIVTHLTSIVLVDDDGDAVDGLSETRKIALSQPEEASGNAYRARAFFAAASAAPGGHEAVTLGMAAPAMRSANMVASGAPAAKKSLFSGSPAGGAPEALFLEQSAMYDLAGAPAQQSTWLERIGGLVPNIGSRRTTVRTTVTETVVTDDGAAAIPVMPRLPQPAPFGPIDWSAAVEVVNGKAVTSLKSHDLSNVLRLSGVAAVIALARATGHSAIAVAIAVLAKVHGAGNRDAGRIERKVLAKAPADLLAAAMSAAA
jgi:hypothetical protein